VTNKQNRWLTGLVMAIGVIAFFGITVVLPFSGAFQQQKAAGPASPSPRPSTSPTVDLEAQAKGYEMVLQREPNNQTALRGLVDTRIQQGKLDAVVEPIQKLADLNPDQPDYGILLAQAKQRLGDREAAAELYRGILEKHPGNINALKGYSDLLIEQQRPEAAVGLLQDTIKSAEETNKAQPGTVDTTSVQLLLGEVYARQDRFDDAIATYDQAIQANAQDFRPVLGKALVLKAQGKTDQAQPLFASAAALAPARFKDQINKLAAAPSPTPSPTPSTSASPSPAGAATDKSAPSGAAPSPSSSPTSPSPSSPSPSPAAP
jgi:tetratricopeptide (TPR) repeat protein